MVQLAVHQEVSSEEEYDGDPLNQVVKNIQISISDEGGAAMGLHEEEKSPDDWRVESSPGLPSDISKKFTP